MAKANATKAVSQADIEAFLKAKAEREAAEAAKTTAAPKAGKPEPVDYAALGATLLHHVCEVTKGKQNAGELVKVFFVSKGRPAVEASKGVDARPAKKPIARIELKDGTLGWMALINMTVKEPMSKADISRLTAMQTAESEETLYVAGRCTGEGPKAVGIDNRGWMRAIWFPRESVTRMDALTEDGQSIFEVPAWKVKQGAGMDSYDALVAKQAMLTALVNKA